MGEELYNTFKKSNKNDSILLKEYLGTPLEAFDKLMEWHQEQLNKKHH